MNDEPSHIERTRRMAGFAAEGIDVVEEIDRLRAAIGTPEVYYGVIDEVIAREREVLAKQVSDLTHRLEVAEAFHDVAVGQRDAAWAENDRLRKDNRILARAYGLYMDGDPELIDFEATEAAYLRAVGQERW